MLIAGRYQVIHPIQTAKYRSFRARRFPDGYSVMLHFLDGGKTPENIEVLRLLPELPAIAKPLFLDVGEHEGSPFVVTELLDNFATLQSWLDRIVKPA